LRQQVRPEFTNIVSDAQKEISAVLTPEQEKRFERYRAERQQFFQPK